MPPGAEGLSMLISTTALTVDDQWSPALSDDRTMKLQVGDALTRTLQRRATEVPGYGLAAYFIWIVRGGFAFIRNRRSSRMRPNAETLPGSVSTPSPICAKP